MKVRLDARVEGRDGSVGNTSGAIIDPATQRLTHLIVREMAFPHRQWLVPADHVVSADDHEVRLDCRVAVARAEPFTETAFVRVDDAAGRPRHASSTERVLWPYDTGPLVLVEREHVPEGEAAVHPGAPVEATDGPVGRLDELVVDPSDDHITHVVLHRGHLWSAKDVTVPLSAVSMIGGDVVRLTLDRDAVLHLPPEREAGR